MGHPKQLAKKYPWTLEGVTKFVGMVNNSMYKSIATARALVYERLGAEELDYIHVEDAVEGACVQFSNLRVKVVNDCGGLRVLVDSLLSRLFYNLVDNSLKHGEKVSKIRVYYEEAKDKLQLVYEDDGVGIPLVEKEKVFEQCYGKGSGLGLYLIKKMCELYGWVIEETGKLGEGARFTMTIPRKGEC